MTKLKRSLIQALDLLGPNGENWIKGKYTDHNGHFCGLGALRETKYPQDRFTDLAEFTPHNVPFWCWQDSPTTNWPEVKALFEKAIAAAE